MPDTAASCGNEITCTIEALGGYGLLAAGLSLRSSSSPDRSFQASPYSGAGLQHTTFRAFTNIEGIVVIANHTEYRGEWVGHASWPRLRSTSPNDRLHACQSLQCWSQSFLGVMLLTRLPPRGPCVVSREAPLTSGPVPGRLQVRRVSPSARPGTRSPSRGRTLP